MAINVIIIGKISPPSVLMFVCISHDKFFFWWKFHNVSNQGNNFHCMVCFLVFSVEIQKMKELKGPGFITGFEYLKILKN